MRKAVWVLGALLLAATLWGRPAQHVRASLMLPQKAKAGEIVQAQIILNHDKNWHTYGPAELGATTLNWTLPAGWTAGEADWPNQEHFEIQGIRSWGYSDTVVLTVPLRVGAKAEQGAQKVKIDLTWVVCGEGMCVPGESSLTAPINIVGIADAVAPQLTSGGPHLTWEILVAAFTGGLILNLMPCVFPVLGVKILSFVKQGGADRKAVIAQAMAYGVGIVLSACALGLLIVAVRSGTEAVGWGFQLQDTRLVWVLVALLALFAMNMAGVWELPSFGTTAHAQASRTQGILGALFSGALMVAVATPCSAPFLGIAIGGVFALPAWQAVFIMFTLGVGMAMPYWLLASWPGAVKFLPKPGVWMEDLKRILAWVMAAAALYMVWVYMGQATSDESLRGLMGLLILMMGVWAMSHWKRIGRFLGVIMLIFGLWLGINMESGQLRWEAWSPQRVEELRAQGRTVIVDYTARWCVNCLVNERVVWGNERIRELVKAKSVSLLKADWTKRDAVIATELKRLGHSAIPLVVVYRYDGPADGVHLTNLLTPQQVEDALK